MGYFRLANLGKDETNAVKNVLSALKKDRTPPAESPVGNHCLKLLKKYTPEG